MTTNKLTSSQPNYARVGLSTVKVETGKGTSPEKQADLQRIKAMFNGSSVAADPKLTHL
jgi:hypothetical protein